LAHPQPGQDLDHVLTGHAELYLDFVLFAVGIKPRLGGHAGTAGLLDRGAGYDEDVVNLAGDDVGLRFGSSGRGSISVSTTVA